MDHHPRRWYGGNRRCRSRIQRSPRPQLCALFPSCHRRSCGTCHRGWTIYSVPFLGCHHPLSRCFLLPFGFSCVDISKLVSARAIASFYGFVSVTSFDVSQGHLLCLRFVVVLCLCQLFAFTVLSNSNPGVVDLVSLWSLLVFSQVLPGVYLVSFSTSIHSVS